eukprot:758412-Hanusia_phi.AAC.2
MKQCAKTRVVLQFSRGRRAGRRLKKKEPGPDREGGCEGAGAGERGGERKTSKLLAGSMFGSRHRSWGAARKERTRGGRAWPGAQELVVVSLDAAEGGERSAGHRTVAEGELDLAQE